MFKKIAYRVLFLLLIGIIMNQFYKSFLLEKDLLEHSPLYENIKNLDSDCRVLYLAESSNFTSHPSDQDKRSISVMASDNFPDINFCFIQQGALHAGNYLIILQKLTNHPNLETIIVTLNLRSFGSDWINSNLETSLQKQMLLLKPGMPLINRLKLSFRGYDIKTDAERRADVLKDWSKPTLAFPHEFPYHTVSAWDKARANGSFTNDDGSWDMERIELSCHFVKNYAFVIDTLKNPRIKDFDQIIELAHENNWNVVFNLLAENTQRAYELVEPELLWLMRKNRELLVARYSRMGAIVVDNLEDVDDMQFIDREWPTEHYAEKGRKIIAHNLADSLQKFYPAKH